MDRENIFQIAQNALDGKYGEEDLLTDLFGILLTLDTQAAGAWFEYVSGQKPGPLTITTQPPFPNYPNDAPDMLLGALEMVLVCEHKVNSPLGERQLERYLALVQAEQARTGIPHRLVFVTRDLVSVPNDVLNDAHYVKPDMAPHYRWQDIYTLLDDLWAQSEDESSPIASLRGQFIAHLRALHLAALKLPDGFVPVSNQNTPEEKEQQRAFGEAWLRTRNWFTEKGYRCHLGSRVQLYVWPTPYSEIPNHRGVSLIIAEPTTGRDMPRHTDFDPPVLEFNINFNEEGGNRSVAMLSSESFRLQYLNLSVAVQLRRPQKDRIRVSFATPLTPLFDTGNLMDALFIVVEEIYNEKLYPLYSDDKL